MFPATSHLPAGARIGAALLAVAALAGCGGDLVTTGPTTGAAAKSSSAVPGGSPAATGSHAGDHTGSHAALPHNAADIAFANRMVPFNVQALASSQIVSQKATDPKVKELAATISKNQLPEIESLSEWLTGWGQPVPTGMIATGPGAVGITESDLSQLSKATGPAFDKLWLNLMVKHQRNGVALAQAEVTQGQSTEAKTLAQKIIKERQAQITTMQGLLAKA